jgi:hypothetical protein
VNSLSFIYQIALSSPQLHWQCCRKRDEASLHNAQASLQQTPRATMALEGYRCALVREAALGMSPERFRRGGGSETSPAKKSIGFLFE